MGGRPDSFSVEKLEVVATGGDFGSSPMDVIYLHTNPAVPGDSFDLLVHFRWTGLAASTWAIEEAISDIVPPGPFPATANFYAESIGPGVEINLGSNTVNLTAGGDPAVNSGPNNSDYKVRLAIADAETVFWDGMALAPGLYRIGCTVSYTGVGGLNEYDAYFQKDLLIRVVEKP